MEPEALRLLGQANQFWFIDGFSHQALTLYREAVDRDPANPVALYQLARALWAIERLDEARALLAQADGHRDRLSERGQQLLTTAIQNYVTPPAFRFPPPVPLIELDVPRLEAKRLSADEWLSVAYAAEEREMFGLAAHAFRRSGGGVRIYELDEDAKDVERKADSYLNRLYVMMTPEDLKKANAVSSLPQPTRLATPALPPSLPASLPPPPAEQTPTPARTFLSQGQVTAHPLAIEICVRPGKDWIGGSLWLDVALVNRSSKPVAANTRLLLNHSSSPPQYGEIYLTVEGPQGYENNTDYHVRAGPPGLEDFSLLEPAQRVTKSYALLKYESFHLAGTYKIWVIYRNTVRDSVKGVPLFIGSLSSQAVSLERRDS